MNDTSYATPTEPATSCLTCRYFRHQEKGNGSCHRFPPSFAGDASPKEIHHWKFPVVGSHAWCGEYQAVEVARSLSERGPE
jgi:hypothetical protein